MKIIEFDINSLHKLQYDILVEFDRICRKHNLTYFLAYGTLLGAVRNDGFIPWDDDIDTMMPYEDYNKLKEVSPSEWKYPYFLQTNETDREYKRCFAKLRNSDTTLITEELSHLDINHGVDLDIYPIVHLADDPKDRIKQYRNTMLFMLLRYDEPPRNHGFIYYYGGKALLAMIPNTIKKKMENYYLEKILKYENIPTKDVYVVNGNIEVMHQDLSSKWFEHTIDHQFEDAFFPIPIGAQEMLQRRYGDNFMQPPAKELQGIKLDGFLKVDLGTPYKEYKGVVYCTGKRRSKVINNRWVKYS